MPSYAVNEIEFWQSDRFDPARIDLELGWAASLGLNAVRVFLHDLLWYEDPSGFVGRVRRFLEIAQAHGIRVVPVLFDSCWDPDPHLGPQPEPRPGVCMSRWVQSPGTRALEDPRQHHRLEEYVRGVVRAFHRDPRILLWDVWNEPDHRPDHQTGPVFAARESPRKEELVEGLLASTFDWVRLEEPVQPLTSGLWQGDWTGPDRLRPIERVQVALSDVLSFHSYEPPAGFEAKLKALRTWRRPLVCTEYMARGQGSTVTGTLPIARRYGVGAFSWGLVAGRTQGLFPWDSWERPYLDGEPAPWFHELLRGDGAPYDPAEAEFLRHLRAPDAAGPASAELV